MSLSSLLWGFLAIAFSGRDAFKHVCACSGWKDCTQARGASLGLKGGLGKSKRLRISVWVINIWVGPKLISALFCSLFQLCFLTFSTGSCVAQKVTQDQSDIISQVGQSVIFNYSQYGIGWFTYYCSIYWYKQLPRGQMTLLIHQNSEHGNAGNARYSVNFQKYINSSASPFQPYSWKTLQNISVL